MLRRDEHLVGIKCNFAFFFMMSFKKFCELIENLFLTRIRRFYFVYIRCNNFYIFSKKYNNYLKDKYGLKYHLLHAGEVRLSDDVVIKDPLPDIFMKICKGESLKL